MKNIIKFFALLLVLLFTLNIYAQDSDVQNDDRGLFSNDESTKEPEKEKKRFWDRYFEIGFNTNIGISNNYFHISDFLKEEIIIDMNDINDGIGNRGLNLYTNLDTDFFLNINTSAFKASIFSGIESKVNFALEKGLIDFLANGNELDQEFDVGAGVGVSVYEENSFSLEIPIKKLKIKAVPSYFVPVFYIPYTAATVTSVVTTDGTVSAKGNTTASVYSALPLDNLSELSYSTITDAFAHGGFDISLYAQYKLFKNLEVGAFLTHVPIVPANLSCTNKYTASLDFTMEGILNQLSENGTVDTSNFNYDLSDNIATDEDSIKLVRPFKIGFNANWKVFDSNILIISPMIQFKFADFTLKNLLGFGFDYSVTAKSYLGPLEPAFTTSYIDSIFSQQLDIALNLRLFEIDFMISTQSANFARSFAGSGLGVGVGFKVGI